MVNHKQKSSKNGVKYLLWSLTFIGLAFLSYRIYGLLLVTKSFNEVESLSLMIDDLNLTIGDSDGIEIDVADEVIDQAESVESFLDESSICLSTSSLTKELDQSELSVCENARGYIDVVKSLTTDLLDGKDTVSENYKLHDSFDKLSKSFDEYYDELDQNREKYLISSGN
ncbi:hypothetical protein JW887_00255 [Candidatus Dojkabacteria bacterium]|nr:hypothetical protein [Candidatus Dojkabacteria bacterium]